MHKTDITSVTELYDVARLFYGDVVPPIYISFDATDKVFTVFIDEKEFNFDCKTKDYNIIPETHRYTRLAKIAVYTALNKYTGREMPWGALTGVRPTKLFYECLRGGKTAEQAKTVMRELYSVSQSRVDILNKIICAQNGKVNFSDKYYNLYVHIPYCTTRCSYCSFVSMPIEKCRDQSYEYVKLLCDEIQRSVELLAKREKKILSIYIGGGTPTALDGDLLDKLLNAIGNYDCEYTCEAGRPDTVTADKCDIMRAHGVTRVCVNPQTLNDDTLIKIGRKHTVEQFFSIYDLVKSRGFDINCDLIAGLENESVNDFINSFSGIKALHLQNITIHSLSKKNGSAIRYASGENAYTPGMLEYVLNNMDEYIPYYLYRQKRQSCNLENIGLSLPGSECVNNITTMEETVSVMACGAGAISKIINNGNITRFANMRDINLYISRYDEKLKAKLEHFSAALG